MLHYFLEIMLLKLELFFVNITHNFKQKDFLKKLNNTALNFMQ